MIAARAEAEGSDTTFHDDGKPEPHGSDVDEKKTIRADVKF